MSAHGHRGARRRLWSGILALGLAGAAAGPGAADAPARAAAEAPAIATYQLYFGGLKALALKAEIAVSNDDYRIRLDAHTEGLTDWIVAWTSQSMTEGAIHEGILRPERHVSESMFRGNRRDTALLFHADGTIDSKVEPSAVDDEREPVTPEQERGALDPISAVLIAMRALAVHGTCDQRVPVFDGRRRYDLEFRDGGRQILKPTEYGSFSGAATLCRFRYIRIAGYQKAGRWNNPKDADRIYSVWLARSCRACHRCRCASRPRARSATCSCI